MLKAGILFPRSGIYPLLGSDFIAGLRSFISNRNLGQEVELILEPIGFGADKKEVYQKAEKLYLVENADILLVFLDQRVVDIIYTIADALQKPLVVINPGANYAPNWVVSENIIFLDLKDILHCRLSGADASAENNHKTILALSYYDGGYHHGHAMVTPYLEKKGEIKLTYISPLKESDFNIDHLSGPLRNDPAMDQIMAVFSGKESNRFLQAISALDLDRRLSIFGSSFMVEKQGLDQIDFEFRHDLSGYLPWHLEIENEENAVFRAVIQKQSNREANVFSLLGWEAGLMIHHYLSLGPEGRTGGSLVQLLQKNNFHSPRGEMIMEPVSHHLLGPVHMVCFNEKGVRVEEKMKAEDSLEEWKALMEKAAAGDSSGWTNTYLCS